MKKKILVYVSLFILFVLALFPAKIVERFVSSNQKLSVSGVDGSLWLGSIGLASVSGFQLSNIEFSTSPIALFMAKLSLDIEIAKGDVVGDLNTRFGRDYFENFSVSNANLSLDADKLVPYIPVKGVKFGGKIETSALSIEVDNKAITKLEGQITWKSLNLAFSGYDFKLGTFKASLSTDKNTGDVQAILVKTNNNLGLEGNATLMKDGTFEFVGSISTEIDESLYNSVALFNNGKPANGRLPIRFKQKIF